MSVNIQTPGGLLKISGDRVTKENINKALGYTPANVDELPEIVDDASESLVIADPSGNIATQIDGQGIQTVNDVVIQTTTNSHSVVSHVEDETRHITAAERTKWDNKSDFSGDYHDLTNQPNIEEDESGMIQIADSNGNIIAQIDGAGITTHEVIVDGEGLSKKLKDHEADMVSHVTSTERVTWNNKSDFSGNYNDLVDAPSIQEEADGTEVVVADNDGNIIARIDSEGLTTHDVIVNKSGESVAEHHNNTTSHITADERISWNNKSEFSGNYTDLVGEPNITEDESGELSIADSAGNVIARVDETGITAHEVTVNGTALGDTAVKHDARIGVLERLVVGPAAEDDKSSVPLVDIVAEHIENSGIHVTTDDKARWDGKTTMSEVEAKDYATNTRVAGLEGTVNTHTSDTNIHITAEERVAWNNKSEFSGNYTDLVGEPDITEDESAELNVADPSGNVILRVDETGARTRNIVIGPHEETAEDPIWDVAETLKSHKAHVDDTVVHVTQADKDYWNEKPTWSGVDGKFVTKETFDSHVTENNKHVEDFNKHVAAYETHTKLVIATETLPSHVTLAERTSWNAKPTTEEVETAITSKKYATQANLDATNKALNETDAALTEHTSNTTIHVTADDKLQWNNKSEFSGNYTDLVGEPDITDEGESQKELTVADSSGNVKLRVDEDGARVDVLVVGPYEATTDRPVYDVGRTLKLHADTITQDRSDFDAHDDDSVRHITAAERTSWNGKTTYSAIEADFVKQSTFNTHTDEFSAHTTDTVKHITAGERTKWNTASTDAAAIKADYATNTALQEHIKTAASTYETITNVNKVSAALDTHKAVLTGDGSHITHKERQAWNAKQTATQVQTAINNAGHAKQTDLDTTNKNLTETTAKIDNHLAATNTHFSGYYVDLVGEPNIEEDESGEVSFADSDGNVIMRVDNDGVRVNQVVIGAAEDPVDVGVKLDQLDRRLIEVGDLRGDWGVASEFITDYTIPADGKATANVEVHMFETFYIHPEYADTYTVSVTYDEWAGTVCDRRILAEHTGTHVVKVARKDGTAVTSGELSTISNIVEHIKTAFSVYFDKLHTMILNNTTEVSESAIAFDTTKLVASE